MGGEAPVRLDPLLEPGQLGTVALNGESGDGPDHFAQEHDDRGGVVEARREPGRRLRVPPRLPSRPAVNRMALRRVRVGRMHWRQAERHFGAQARLPVID